MSGDTLIAQEMMQDSSNTFDNVDEFGATTKLLLNEHDVTSSNPEKVSPLVEEVSTDDIEDHISKLPNDLTCHIFTFLNVKEVIRTKILSCIWRDRSMEMSKLVFDPTLVNIDLDDDVTLESIPLHQKHQYVERVDQLLKIFTIKKSASFEIWFPLGETYTSHIDKWVTRAIDSECEKLELEFKFAKHDDEPYDFPFDIILSSKKSHLKYLSLCECEVTPTRDVASRLNLLESLTLVYVDMDESDLEILLSSCLNLQLLELIDCEVLESLRIFNQDMRLKRFYVNPLMFVANIELCIPSLEFFKFYGRLENLVISRMNQLNTVELTIGGIYPRGMNQLLDQLSTNAPLLQILRLSGYFDQFLSHTHNNNQTPQFNNLTHLELTHSGEYGWNAFIAILYKSPKLEVLIIKGCDPPAHGVPNWTNPQMVPTCISSTLKRVTFNEFEGQDYELNMVACILKYASVLEHIKFIVKISNKKVKKKIIKKIKALPKSSSEAKVSFW